MAGSLNVFLKISVKRAEFFSENFSQVENNLIYAEATQVL